MTIWQNLLIIGFGCMLNCVVTMWVFHWRRREEEPRADIEQLQRDLVNVREDIARIKGRLNGKGWLREV
jgi:hypothetical protein